MIAKNIDCVIARRLLVNYRIDPEHVAALLPNPFRPQLVGGHAVGGVCFIRLSRIRPAHLPSAAGMATENVAHRFAVEWDDADGTHAGVWVPRRETSSRMTATFGSYIFPGAYHLARFQVTETASTICIDVRSRDGKVSLSAEAAHAEALSSELFTTLDDAMGFFRPGALGFSPSASHGMDLVCLQAASWAARPMTVGRMHSSFFNNAAAFPRGTCTLDSALLMTNIAARWAAGPNTALAQRTAS